MTHLTVFRNHSYPETNFQKCSTQRAKLIHPCGIFVVFPHSLCLFFTFPSFPWTQIIPILIHTYLNVHNLNSWMLHHLGLSSQGCWQAPLPLSPLSLPHSPAEETPFSPCFLSHQLSGLCLTSEASPKRPEPYISPYFLYSLHVHLPLSHNGLFPFITSSHPYQLFHASLNMNIVNTYYKAPLWLSPATLSFFLDLIAES